MADGALNILRLLNLEPKKQLSTILKVASLKKRVLGFIVFIVPLAVQLRMWTLQSCLFGTMAITYKIRDSDKIFDFSRPQFSPLFPWGESRQGCCDSELADPLSGTCCLQLVWPLSEASALSLGLCPRAPVSPRSSDNSMLWAPMRVRSCEHHTEKDMVRGCVL